MYYNKDTYSIYYETYGKGEKTILILPGWGNTRETFYQIINYFKINYKIYIFDYPGFVSPSYLLKNLNIFYYTNFILVFITYHKINKHIIIANSFVVIIATLLSAYYKEDLEKLIFMDIAGIKPKKNIFKQIKLYTYKFLKKLKSLIPKRKQSLYLKRLINLFGSNDYKALNKDMQQSFKNIVNEDLKPYIKYIEQQTLIIWGKKDKDTPVKDAKFMRKQIKNSSLVIYPDASHFSYLKYPKLTNQIIENFIKNTD